MLYTDFTEKLLGLQDLKVTKIEKNEKAVCIYAELPRKTHNCICCGTATDTIHDYYAKLVCWYYQLFRLQYYQRLYRRLQQQN